MKKHNNFWWPDHDKHCHPVVPSQLADLDNALKYVEHAGVCVQAGGNVGVWAKKLAGIFGAVYTFEPDPENFNCLAKNVPEHNVIKFNSALGNKHEMIRVGSSAKHEDFNCGAYQVLGEGITPTLRIDDLNLPALDLLYLDIEGYELFALQGADETIHKYRPVIALEQKPLPLMYGNEPDTATEYLVARHGYTVKERIHRDTILVKE